MFRIHSDQVQAFAARRREQFEVEARAALTHMLGREVPRDFVHASVDRALARGFDTDSLAWQVVVVEARLGGDVLASWAWAEAIFGDERLTPLGKLRTLLREAGRRGEDVRAIDFVNRDRH